MELKYLQKLKDTPSLNPRIKIEGLGKDKIQELESHYNRGDKFPLAFREYLFLAGVRSGTGVVDNDFEELREDCEEDLEYCGYSMERPYFVFDRLDDIYSIFFLDEDKEDPDIYILHPLGAYEGNEPFLKDVKYTFSKMINDAIHRKLNNIPL
ncbi:hypothetical protein KUL113_49480 [Tenacibaculum sp. KUL113]|nr:hypothetical protein KUL113_49480 [Tenacibaculum sp. KUL113]